MKHTPFLSHFSSCMTLLLLITLLSCKKEDDKVTPANGVEGTWQPTAVNITPAVLGISNYFDFYALIGDKCPSQTTFDFQSNGSINIVAPPTCDASKAEFMTQVGITNSTTWKMDNNKMILTTGSATRTLDLSVNETTMTLTAPDIRVPQDTLKHTVVLVFKRV